MISVIIPTYNESESIVDTITNIIHFIPKNVSYEIIIADDDSPDKTWELVEKTYKINKHVKTLHRTNKPKGLSLSVIDAFTIAKGDYFMVTDGDGQHDPSIIPQLLKEIQSHDIVLGSRFIPGGSVKGWSRKRIFVSKVAALLAKPLLIKT